MDAVRERQQHIEEDRASFPKLPPADSWDTQTGHNMGVLLQVRAYYRPHDASWFTLKLSLDWQGEDKPLAPAASMVSRNPSHDPPAAATLKALSIAKSLLAAHGAELRDIVITNPGLMDPESSTIIHMDAWVFGRLGVALDMVDGVVQVRSVN